MKGFDWIYMARDRVQWWDDTDMVTKFEVAKNGTEFLVQLRNHQLLKRITLFQGDTVQTGRLSLGSLPQFLNTKVTL
jgi:hypothetical protein